VQFLPLLHPDPVAVATCATKQKGKKNAAGEGLVKFQKIPANIGN